MSKEDLIQMEENRDKIISNIIENNKLLYEVHLAETAELKSERDKLQKEVEDLTTNQGRLLIQLSDDNAGLHEEIEQYRDLCGRMAEALEWSKAQFKRLADEGRYPEFMLANNGGDGCLPIIDALTEHNNLKDKG